MSPLQKVVFFNMGTSKCLQIESKIEYLSSKRGVFNTQIAIFIQHFKAWCTIWNRFDFLCSGLKILFPLRTCCSSLRTFSVYFRTCFRTCFRTVRTPFMYRNSYQECRRSSVVSKIARGDKVQFLNNNKKRIIIRYSRWFYIILHFSLIN